MLAKVASPTRDFQTLARYLIHGKGGVDPKRVAWTLAHNLPTDDPELAAKLMAATAALSPRTRRAVYHLMIAWAPDERPTMAMMQTVAVETLERSGLSAHQALVMGHGDTPHAHLHMMINRVHPGTGIAWRTSQDYARFDRIMKELAEAHGFRAVPAHAFSPDETDVLPKRPNSRATHAARRGAPTSRPQWSRAEARELGARLSERLDGASTWEDLQDAVAREGYGVEAKGRGFVVGDAAGYAKLSSLRLTHTARDVRRRVRRRRTDPNKSQHSRGRPWVDEVDIARALVTMGLADRDAVGEAIAEANAARVARLEKEPLLVQLLHGWSEAQKASTSLSPHPVAQRVAKPRRERRERGRSR